MKNIPSHPSELAWTLSDYEAAGQEAPGRIKSNPTMTEGEMMTADEVQEFIKDSIATLRILSDKKSARYEELELMFVTDLAYLAQVGQIDEDDYNELTSPDNLTF
jgi:hypothetical protein